jgi:large subunit ribosomal protein L24
MLWDASAKAPSKVKRERTEGKSVRVLKKSGSKL